MPRSRSRSRSRSRRRRSSSRDRRSRSLSLSRSRHRGGGFRSAGRFASGSRRSRSPPPRRGPRGSPPRRQDARFGSRGGDLRSRLRRSPSHGKRFSPPRSRPGHSRMSPERSRGRPDRSREDRSREDRSREDRSREDRQRHTSPGVRRKSPGSPRVTPSLRPVRPKGELGYTGRSLNERFASKYDPLDFTPDDNISVAIERNIKGNAEAKVDVPLNPTYVSLPRRKDEGETPLTEREEFVEREEEEEEKRTITVKAASMENRRLLDKLDKQYGVGSSRMDSRVVPRQSDSFRGRPAHHAKEDSRGDLRDRLGKKRRLDSREEGNWQDDPTIMGDRRRIDAGRLAGRLGAPDPLPDFSVRPDKYQLSWVDDPAMIPTSGMYYEHDTRDNPEYNSRGERRTRGRGRADFRGRGGRGFNRGSFRGSYRGFRDRGRGRGWRPASEPAWKHDKFMDDEDDGQKSEERGKRDSEKYRSRDRKDSEKRQDSGDHKTEAKVEEPSSTT